MLLVPSDPAAPARPDPHFFDEAEAARALGIAVAVVDHDLLGRAGCETDGVRRVPAGTALYRGWMLAGERYAAFARALTARGATLRTDAAAYRRAHELPGWYAALAAHTPASLWTDGASLAELRACCARLGAGPAVLRDFVKSAKYEWAEACFIPDVADAVAVERVARRLVELRGDDFAGGFVLRRFERFRGAEVRSWWVDGECRLLTAHPDTPDALPPPELDVALFAPAMVALASPFATLDLAQNADGQWRVIEAGDGQVSDRPTSLPAASFLAAILPRATKRASWK